jgi:hypothetical protein
MNSHISALWFDLFNVVIHENEISEKVLKLEDNKWIDKISGDELETDDIL